MFLFPETVTGRFSASLWLPPFPQINCCLTIYLTCLLLFYRYAFVYFNDEDEEKALRLDGSDMGGRILQIKSYPFHATYLNHVLDPMKEGLLKYQHT